MARWMNTAMTSESLTTTPVSATKPIMAMNEIGWPCRKKPTMMPMAPNGMASMTSTGQLRRLNCTARITKMPASA